MAITSFTEIGPKKNLVPDKEISRINYHRRMRNLFRQDFLELGIQPSFGTIAYEKSFVPIATEKNRAIRINWFRRLATFYPEFMLAERPVISIDGNERFTEIVADLGRNLFPMLQRANVDMLKFGEGIITTHPQDPLQFIRIEPDYHYTVVNELGEVQGDIIVVVREDQELIDVIKYRVTGESTWTIHKYAPGVVGEHVRSVPIPGRRGRQVVELNLNADKTSLFEDIRDAVGEISRTLGSLSHTIERNAKPHLFGPSNAVQEDERGNVVLDVNGQYFGLNADDVTPGYLQWDSGVEAINWEYDTLKDTIFEMTGLSKAMFTPESIGGDISGIALKRMYMPFVAKLNHFKEINNHIIEEILFIYNMNRAVSGLEIFSFEMKDINVEWTFEEIFNDEPNEPVIEGGDSGPGTGDAPESGESDSS